MPESDVYGRAHQLDPATVDAIAARLEARRGSPRYMRMLHDYLDELDLAAARDVLMLGAGTGVEARELALRPGFAGTITALEISERLVGIGRGKAEAEGVGGRIAWRTGDAQALDLPDASFDLVTAHTLVSHVDDPARVLAEAARVLRPGGTLVVFDGDYATLAFGADDPEQGRAWEERLVRGLFANPRVMRSLPRVLRQLGLELAGSHTYALHEIGQADFFLGSLRSFPVLLPRAGVATAEEAQAFVDDQLRSSGEGAFFAGYNFVTLVARRPRPGG